MRQLRLKYEGCVYFIKLQIVRSNYMLLYLNIHNEKVNMQKEKNSTNYAGRKGSFENVPGTRLNSW